MDDMPKIVEVMEAAAERRPSRGLLAELDALRMVIKRGGGGAQIEQRLDAIGQRLRAKLLGSR